MTQEQAKTATARMLSMYPLYMVMTHQSRTSSTRHYRLVTANGERIEDVTALVCSAIGKLWDNARGTYNARGTMRSQDSSDLAHHLQQWCGIQANVTVL